VKDAATPVIEGAKYLLYSFLVVLLLLAIFLPTLLIIFYMLGLLKPRSRASSGYEEYLQTPYWKRRREDKLRAVGRTCQLCNRGSVTLDVHHRTYERLGNELDEDLTVLCRDCHSIYHRLGRH
jgi:hypothetical protein